MPSKPIGSGVPIRLLHEAEGHIVSIEMRNGDLYKGTLVESLDNMNVKLMQVMYYNSNNSETGKAIQQVYIRGSQIRFISMPSMLKHAPMFQRFDPKAKVKPALGLGRGFDGNDFSQSKKIHNNNNNNNNRKHRR